MMRQKRSTPRDWLWSVVEYVIDLANHLTNHDRWLMRMKHCPECQRIRGEFS